MAVLDRVKERTGSDLSDNELQGMIDAITAELDARLGPAGEITLNMGITGPHYTIGAACAAGNAGLIQGAQMLMLGECDFAIAGGVSESIRTFGIFAGFASQGALATHDDPAKASRTILVDMNDTMRFRPDQIRIRRGETVRFVVGNSGKVMHEMVIGTADELRAHAELMKKHPGMEHDAPYMAHVAPGKKETLTWTFDKSGAFMYGCLVPGHWEAGMKGTIVVE